MADSSGHGATGVYNASNAQLGQAGPLVSDPATAAAGNGGVIGQSYPKLPIYNQARTVEAWVKTTDCCEQYLAGWGSTSTGEGFDVAVDASHVYVEGYGDDLSFSTSVALASGGWHFVAVTSNGTSATVYINGASLGAKSFPTTLNTLPSESGLVVGAAIWRGGGLTGDLADLAVFPIQLTASQIAAQYGAR
jgi:hypothetical protein